MRLGVISDIHGNLVALERVLDALNALGVDGLVCLGDLAALGPQPAACVARVHDLGCPVVMGNTDAWLLDPPPQPDETPGAAVNRWCAEQLDAGAREFLSTLPPTHVLDLPGSSAGVLCVHGSPASFDDVIAASTPEDELDAHFARGRADVMLGGHTHVSLWRRAGSRVFANPGSVGLPCARCPQLGGGMTLLPWAEFAVLDAAADRPPSLAFHRVPLPLSAVRRAASRSGMPHADWWSGRWPAG